MRALLSVRDQPVVTQAKQQAGIVLTRVAKFQGPTWQHVGFCRKPLFRQRLVSGKQTRQPDPALTGHERAAGQDQELGEFASGEGIILGNVDGEILPPARLLGQRPAIRKVALHFALAQTHGISFIHRWSTGSGSVADPRVDRAWRPSHRAVRRYFGGAPSCVPWYGSSAGQTGTD